MQAKSNYYLPIKPTSTRRFLTPVTVGACSALAFAVRPSVTRRFAVGAQLFEDSALVRRVHAVVPLPVTSAILGFLAGYAGYHVADWLRWKLLRRLLTYCDWINAPNSLKTKVWGILVKQLVGPGPFSSDHFQSVIPRQPVPDLEATLDRWLMVTKQWMTAEEYEQTKEAVHLFQNNEGPKLQQYLKEKAEKSDAWLSDYWVNIVYLSSRASLAVNSNYFIACGNSNYEPPPDQIARAASWVLNSAKYGLFVNNAENQPDVILDTIPLCMRGYSFIFGTTRVPGPTIDSLRLYKSSHVVVIRKGHYFVLEMMVPLGGNGKNALLTYEEMKQQLNTICDIADSLPPTPNVAVLTSQKRDVWAKNREALEKLSPESLAAVESSLFVTVLDQETPKDCHHFEKLIGIGRGYDRWFDKSFTHVTFKDASMGMNLEHTGFDATNISTLCEYGALHEHYENGTLVAQPDQPSRPLPEPKVLTWNVDGLEKNIVEAEQEFKQMSDQIDFYCFKGKYGKGFMKKKKISPDGYIQMLLQLAYYRLCKEVPKTYEPATARLFVRGRTETVHPGSAESVLWVKAMDDPGSSKERRQDLFRKAIKHQSKFRLDATVGRGCDRHLFALYCASRELGMDIPTLFLDKAWRMPYKLSTSQTPNRLVEISPRHDFSVATGGFGPSCEDGYGACYLIMGDDLLNIIISSWKTCIDTDSTRFAEALHTAMDDCKTMLL